MKNNFHNKNFHNEVQSNSEMVFFPFSDHGHANIKVTGMRGKS